MYSNPTRVGDFSFLQNARTVCGPNQPPVQLIPATHSSGLNRPGLEADRSLPSSDDVKDDGYCNWAVLLSSRDVCVSYLVSV